MGNMFDMPETKKSCPVMSAGIGAALMNHAIDDMYKAIVLQDKSAVGELGMCIGIECAWWDDSRQCCGVISK